MALIHENVTKSIILESAVGRGRVCVFGGAGQGAMTRNSYSIPRSCNEDDPHGCGKCRFRQEHEPTMCHQKRAIYLVAWFTQQVKRSIEQNTREFNSLKSRMEWSTAESRIIGTAFEVDRILGYEFLGKVYQKAMQVESTRLRYQINPCVIRVNLQLYTH